MNDRDSIVKWLREKYSATTSSDGSITYEMADILTLADAIEERRDVQDRDEATLESPDTSEGLESVTQDSPFDTDKQREAINKHNETRMQNVNVQYVYNTITQDECVKAWVEQIGDAELYEQRWNELQEKP